MTSVVHIAITSQRLAALPETQHIVWICILIHIAISYSKQPYPEKYLGACHAQIYR